MLQYIIKKIFNRSSEYTVNQIDEKTLNELRKNVKNLVLVDVRSVQEYNEGHMRGAILMQSFEAERKAEMILPDKDAFIVLYCSSGARSRKVARILLKKGYRNINVLEQ